MSHPDNTHRIIVKPWHPSAIAPGTQMFTASGMQGHSRARAALTTEEVRRTRHRLPACGALRH